MKILPFDFFVTNSRVSQMNKIYITLLIVIFSFLGCSLPHEKDVIADFENQYPEREVISAVAGKRDSNHVFFYIQYKGSDSKELKTEVWYYQRYEGSKKWFVAKMNI